MAWWAQNEEDTFYLVPVWENYAATSRQVLFSSHPGRKTVVVRFKDFAGNISQVEISIRLLGLPAAFGKTLPANSAINVATNPTLSWSGSNGALSYEFCYDPINNDNCDSDWIRVGSNTAAALTGLGRSTTYYWQVRGINLDGSVSANNNTWWSFTTVPPVSAAFGKTIPGMSATNVPLHASLFWSNSSGATEYEYCHSTSDDGVCRRWSSAGTSTTAVLSGLDPETVYYWQVRARNAGGTAYADGGAWWRFMTVPVPPAPFGKSLPADGAANVSLNPTLSWADGSGAYGYEYCYDTSNNGSCDGVWISAGTNTTAALIGLSPSTSYYWQVRAVNPGGTTAADSDVGWSFNTMALPPSPSTFSKSLPAHGATNVPVNPTLSWTGSSSATGYQYCYDTFNNDSCDSGWIGAGTNTAAALIGLSINTTYYWQVRAISSGGSTYADGGAWGLFSTMGNPPPDITKTLPSSGATGILLNPNLTWTANSNATEYAYCFDTTNDNSCDGSWIGTGTSTSAALSGLSTNTTYYWQVQATIYGRTVNADNDTWWSFRTAASRVTVDFDGDGISDIAVWRPNTGIWFALKSSAAGSYTATQWGIPSDKPVPGDYDGDQLWDIAVWRPGTGMWFLLSSNSPGNYTATQWGANGDIPVPADYDGDGKADIAVFRPGTGVWYVLLSGTPGSYISIQWGLATDIPVPGDYDGDGKTDVAVWRPSIGIWYVLNSGTAGSYTGTQWGVSSDIPTPGDFDADGKADIAVWRPDPGVWYIRPSSTAGYTATLWGTNGDTPVSGDFDGDGKADVPVWRSSNGTWYVLSSGTPGSYTSQQWGMSEDIPISTLTGILDSIP
jgi:hypothetical protein